MQTLDISDDVLDISNPGDFDIVRRLVDSDAKVNNTLADDDTLLFAVQANASYFFEAWLLFSAANATMDGKIGWSVPSGTTMIWGSVGASATDWSMAGTGGTPGPLKSESQTRDFGTLTGTNGLMLAGHIIGGDTAGIANLRWAQATTDAGELKLLENSFLRVSRLA